MKKTVLLLIVLYAFFKAGYSQPGKLDPSFGNNGIVTTNIGAVYNYNFDNSSFGKQVLLNPAGGSFVVVNASVLNGTVIAKRLADGSADLGYGNKGFSASVPVNDPHAALQADGKIVVAGWTYRRFISAVSLARYNTDGSIDTTFNQDRNEIIDFGSNLSIAIQSDGKIVVAGSVRVGEEDTNFGLTRFNADGKPDSSFGDNGKVLTSFGLSLPPDRGGTYPENDYTTSLVIGKDGKIFAAGYAYNYATFTFDFAIAKYNSDGTLDKKFGKDGTRVTDFASADDYLNAIAIQSDGKIVVAGSSGSDFAVARYNANGSPDRTFDNDGKLTTDFGSSYETGYSVALQSNGKIVVSGYILNGSSNDFAIVRYNANGRLDNTFSGDGKQVKRLSASDDYANSAVIQNDGKILVGGYTSTASHSDFTLVRYNTNGSEDNSFNGQGKLNKIPNQGFTNFTCIAAQKDGKIVAAGYCWNGRNFDFALARYNADGSLDTTFSGDGKRTTDFASSDDKAAAIAIQNDGKIVLAGVSNSDFVLARYNSNGSLDNSFNRNGKQITDFAFSDDEATSVAIQSDGKIVAAGRSNKDFAIARYNSNGSLDNTFSNNGKKTSDFNSSDDYAYSLAIQKDGKIVVAGTTLSMDVNSNAEFALARYNKDGTPDTGFGTGGKQTTSFGYMYNFAYSVALQDDGKILAAGYSGDPSLFAIARYNENGNPDSTFSDDGRQTTDFGFDYNIARSIAIQGNGKILIAGYVFKDNGLNFGIASYSTNGRSDLVFSEDGIEITEASDGDNFITGIAVSNNKLYVAGTGRYPGDQGVVARYTLEENEAPKVSIAIPGNVVKYTSPATVRIKATATDTDGTISKVEFYRGATLLHTETVIPYGFIWRNVPAGTYTLTAKATDNSGNVATSNTITITVKNALPVVSIIKPVSGTTYSAPACVDLEADAKDPDGRITRVEFYNGSTLLRTEYKYPYTYHWTNVPAGTYTITAIATDNWGAHTTSKPVTVKIESTNGVIVSNKQAISNETLLNNHSGFTISPNPAVDVINLYIMGLQQNKPVTVSVISTSGVAERVIQLSNSAKTLQLDVSSLVKGVYTIRLITGNKVMYKQFVKL
jgi:uncharacterized delta-60 repeat protein